MVLGGELQEVRKEVSKRPFMVTNWGEVYNLLLKRGLSNYTQEVEPVERAFKRYMRAMEEGRMQEYLFSTSLKEFLKSLKEALEKKGAYFDGRAKRAAERKERVRYEIATDTNVGKVRKQNEDAVFSDEFQVQGFESLGKFIVLGVADGMGGHTDGEVASRIISQNFSNNFQDIFQRLLYHEYGQFMAYGTYGYDIDILDKCVFSAMHNAICEVNSLVHDQRNTMKNDMGSTLTVAVAYGEGKVVVGHVGDSRAYVVGKFGINQVTKDDSHVQNLIDSGEITKEQARTHPERNLITKSVGGESIEPQIYKFNLDEGQTLLLCSDGLNDVVRDEEIMRILNEKPKLKAAARNLIKAANNAGGPDNISVALLRLGAGMAGMGSGISRIQQQQAQSEVFVPPANHAREINYSQERTRSPWFGTSSEAKLRIESNMLRNQGELLMFLSNMIDENNRYRVSELLNVLFIRGLNVSFDQQRNLTIRNEGQSVNYIRVFTVTEGRVVEYSGSRNIRIPGNCKITAVIVHSGEKQDRIF